jgi:hypothetical protein
VRTAQSRKGSRRKTRSKVRELGRASGREDGKVERTAVEKEEMGGTAEAQAKKGRQLAEVEKGEREPRRRGEAQAKKGAQAKKEDS